MSGAPEGASRFHPVARADLTASAEVVVSAEVTNVARVTDGDQLDPDGTNDASVIVTVD